MKKKSPEDGNAPKKKATGKKTPAHPDKEETKAGGDDLEVSRGKSPTEGPPKITGGGIAKLRKPMRTGITKITIENFKGVADKVEIPIRPITLLFGANSAGKSTILQALLYLRELLEGRSPDTDRMMAGGASLDLGGFRDFVHGRLRGNRIRVGVEVRLDDDGLPNVGWDAEDPDDEPIAAELDGVREVSVDVCVEWSNENWKPYITHYQVGLDGEPFAAIRTRPGGESQLDVVNLNHPLVAIDDDGEATLFDELANAFNLNFAISPILDTRNDDVRGDQRLLLGSNATPDFGRGLPEKWAYPPLSDEQRVAATRSFNVLNRAMTGAGNVILSELRKIRYIGPIRRIPERNFQPVRSPGENRWADGSGAWDLLLGERMDLEWFEEEPFADLGLGVVPRYQSYFEVPNRSLLGMIIDRALERGEDDIDKLFPDDISDLDTIVRRSRVQLVREDSDLPMMPCDVGIGVSQALPVAIGAMAPGYRILAVEQPELHIHPAIQCNLGDLLAKQVIKDEGRTMLLETHSEHLILRMLRRIRENTEGTLDDDKPALVPEHLSVLWVEQHGGVVAIKPIPVNPQGDFDEEWPKGFFEERFDEYE
ncbi:AAA family ATPase [Akkermansiaceae bacterium]|nr:AAA family ATPase [Akkermansiaceae bacterium]